jgi:putative hydrolase of the HAD superfamily
LSEPLREGTLSAMSRPPTARALLLDLGGVVLRNGRELMRGSVVDERPELAAYVRATDFAGASDELWQAMLRHELTERAYWAKRAAEVGEVLGHEGWTTLDLIGLLYDCPESEYVNAELVELMVDARAAGIPVVALTNDLTDFHGPEWVDAQEWLKDFDAVVDGSLTGVLKPAPEAYAAGVTATGVPAEEIVYLDDMPWNVAGGLAVGLQAIEVMYDDRHAAVVEARRRLGLSDNQQS